MYTFTQDGLPATYTPTLDDVALTVNRPSDVRNLGLWIAAAHAADEAGHCSVYDNLAEEIGAPTRDDLRDAGLLDSEFTVEGTRTVTITVTLPFSATYRAARPGDVRRNFDADEIGDVDSYDLAQAVRDGNYSTDDDTDFEIDTVERD